MSFVDKFRSLFFSEQNKSEVIPIEKLQEAPKGDLVGMCPICKGPIGSDERTRQFSGHPCHKKCVKKLTKSMLQGSNFEAALESTAEINSTNKEVENGITTN